MEHTSEFLKPEPGSRAEDAKRMSRRAAWGLPFFALAACGDGGGDSAPSPVSPPSPASSPSSSSSVEPDDVSRDGTDETIFTLTFSDDLQASSVQATDFTITDSNGGYMRVSAARVVRGMADEVELTGTRAWEGTHTLSFSEGAIRDDVGVSLDDGRVTITFSDSPAPSPAPTSSVEPDDISRDGTDETIFTLTFSDDLQASSVQATDFTITDSNGRDVRVSAAKVVRGMADEVELTGTRAWEGTYTLSLSEGAIRDDVGVSLDDSRVTLTFADAPAPAPRPVFSDFTLTFFNPVEANLGSFDEIFVFDEGDLASELFSFTKNAPGRPLASILITDATFYLYGREVPFGTGYGELLGIFGGFSRGDFNAVEMTLFGSDAPLAATSAICVHSSGLADAYGSPVEFAPLC